MRADKIMHEYKLEIIDAEKEVHPFISNQLSLQSREEKNYRKRNVSLKCIRPQFLSNILPHLLYSRLGLFCRATPHLFPCFTTRLYNDPELKRDGTINVG